MPFVKSKCPLATRSLRSLERDSMLHQFCNMLASCPSLRCSFRKKHLSHAEKQSVWSQSCGLQNVLKYCDCALGCAVRPAANQRTLVQIELLATMGWNWGCQPFGCRCSQNVMHCRKEICSTCLFETSTPAVPFWNSKHYSLLYCKWSMYSFDSTAKSCCFEDLTK